MDPPGMWGGVLGVEIFTKMCKKKFCLKMREKSRKIFRLRRATFVEQYDIWCN